MADIASTILQLDDNNLDLVNKIRTKYVTSGLSYGWKANTDRKYDQGHWNKLIVPNSKRFPCDYDSTLVLNNHPEIKSIWEVVKDTIGNRGFYRTYINGYTYGTDGYAHQDDNWITKRYGKDALSETAILYLNPTWDIDWGGETVIFENHSNTNNDIAESVLPKFGRIFVFQSDRYHASRPLSRVCTVLRSILVIKTIDSLIVSPQIKFIADTTRSVKHSGRTFFEHLFGTMLKLESRKNRVSDDILLAGLYHSIYGTEFFDYKNTDINRDVIKGLIGEYAESLAYEFCNMKNRMNTLMTNSNGYKPRMLSDLIKIESCNLEDQNSNGIYDRHISQLEDRLTSLPA